MDGIVRRTRTKTKHERALRASRAWRRSGTRALTRFVWSPRTITTDEWLAQEPDPLGVIYGMKARPLRLTIVPNPPGSEPEERMASDRAGRPPELSTLTFVAPSDAKEPSQVASEPKSVPRYTFHKHFDYGLLREGPPGSLNFEAWMPAPFDRWHAISFNPFTASMSEINTARAREIAGEHLFDPAREDAS
jgi:hypothetical protein